jgi:PAS domain S-box-containing protein
MASEDSFARKTAELERKITECKLAQEELLKSKEQFQVLVESSSDWIWEVDRNGVYTYVSPKVEDILGYKPEEVVGKTPFDLMPPEEAKRIAATFKGLIGRREPIVAIENVNLHKDGRRVVLETSGVPVFDAAGNVHGYRGGIGVKNRCQSLNCELMLDN